MQAVFLAAVGAEPCAVSKRFYFSPSAVALNTALRVYRTVFSLVKSSLEHRVAHIRVKEPHSYSRRAARGNSVLYRQRNYCVCIQLTSAVEAEVCFVIIPSVAFFTNHT